jgi:hypothetical protein
MHSPAERAAGAARAFDRAADTAGMANPADTSAAMDRGSPMRPPAGARVAAEWGLHALAAGLLLWGALRSREHAASGNADRAVAGTLHGALVKWSTIVAPTSAHVEMDSMPPVTEREWLAALPGAGTRVTWGATSVVPLAVAASPVADPAGVTRIRLAAPRGATVILRDAVGVLDTVSVDPMAAGGGMTITLPGGSAAVDATVGRTTARAVTADSLPLKHVLVLGRVGWETRFIVDALEERGWRVDARLTLAPKNDIVQGPRGAIDTARYAAVVVADSSASADATRLAGYTRSGGGLVLAGSAATMPAIRGLAPATLGALIPGGVIARADTLAITARSHLGVLPLVDLRVDAVALEARGSVAVVAARREGAGRVVQTGYIDSWRWRMGADHGIAAHRAWWAGLVSAVAYAPAVARAPDRTSDNAPVAHLIDAFGPTTTVSGAPVSGSDPSRRGWLFAVIVIALGAEWASRRLRGAR